MLKDISISSTKVRGRPKGRPENRKIRTLNRLKRLNKPVEFVFINDTNYRDWSLKVNYWNEGFKKQIREES